MPPKTEKKTKVKKEGPKKNKSAYMFFCVDARKEINSEQEGKEDKMDNKEIVREQGRRWKSIQNDEKKLETYKKLAEEDKKRYEKEKEAFGPVEAKPKKTKAEKVEKEEKEKKPKKKVEKKAESSKKKKEEVEEDDEDDEDKSESESVSASEGGEEDEEEVKEEKPKKTRVNGYINYTKEMREKVKKSNPKLTPKEVTSELSKQWKELSDSEKEKFKNK